VSYKHYIDCFAKSDTAYDSLYVNDPPSDSDPQEPFLGPGNTRGSVRKGYLETHFIGKTLWFGVFSSPFLVEPPVPATVNLYEGSVLRQTLINKTSRIRPGFDLKHWVEQVLC
jgi:hypothetical protein